MTKKYSNYRVLLVCYQRQFADSRRGEARARCGLGVASAAPAPHAPRSASPPGLTLSSLLLRLAIPAMINNYLVKSILMIQSILLHNIAIRLFLSGFSLHYSCG